MTNINDNENYKSNCLQFHLSLSVLEISVRNTQLAKLNKILKIKQNNNKAITENIQLFTINN